MVSSDHRVYYSNNDLTSDSTSHAITCDNFTRSRNLVIGYFADIIIVDIIVLGREIDVSQKFDLADKTCYIVYLLIASN